MKNVWGLLFMAGIGWVVWEMVTPETWWMVGKWVGTGLFSLILLYVLIWNIKNRAEQREFERQEALMDRQRKKMKPMQVQPQIMYMQPPPTYNNQAPPQPAGLVDLPIEQYEWEV